MTFKLPFEYDNSVTRHFGPVWNGTEFEDEHYGIDWRRDEGEPVHCPSDGVVTLTTEDDSEAGFSIWIQHGTGAVISVCAHLMEMPEFQKGDVVKEGQIIGLVGNTGNSTDPHLHFETIVRGDHYNPVTVSTKWEELYSGVEWVSTEESQESVNASDNA